MNTFKMSVMMASMSCVSACGAMQLTAKLPKRAAFASAVLLVGAGSYKPVRGYFINKELKDISKEKHRMQMKVSYNLEMGDSKFMCEWNAIEAREAALLKQLHQ